jgi:hypothetical protein
MCMKNRHDRSAGSLRGAAIGKNPLAYRRGWAYEVSRIRHVGREAQEMVGTSRRDAARKADERQLFLLELRQTIDAIALLPGWDDEDSQAALVMLAVVCIGSHDPDRLSRFTGVALPVVQQVCHRLLENGVWGLDGSLNAEWTHPTHGHHAFQCDVFVATGKLKRARRQVVAMPPGEAVQ